MKRILIFASRTGGGHISLAEALHDLLSQDFEVTILDPQPSIIHWHYRTVSRHALWLWEAEFKLSDGRRRARAVHAVSSVLLARRVSRALRQVDPHLVMSTYPFLTSEVTFAMRRWKVHRPLVMLFSDPNGVHYSWLTEKRAAITLAPTRETYRQALAAGFDPSRIHLTGWPVRGQFYHADPGARPETLNGLGLSPERFTVFAQGGGEGAARFAQTVETISTVPGVQVIMAAGTNEGLVRQFSDRPNIHALPFTRQIAPYMMAADVVMGKAGPNMLFESVTLGKPFIATAYIPGQEEVNLEFIQRHQLGWVALDHRNQRQLVEELSQEPPKLDAMRESVNRYREMNTEGTRQIPQLIRDLV
jgi:UDP-N-acetylglucosamine:LPS N-acetylglucosamine transferase